MGSRTEKQLKALLNDTTADVDLISRVDKYLNACCEGCGCEDLPEPITRIDHLLYELAEKLKNKFVYGTTSTDDQSKMQIPEGKDNFILQVSGEEHQQMFVCTVIKLPNNAAIVFDYGNSYCGNTPEQVFLQHDKLTGTISFSLADMFFKTNTDYIYAAW